MKPWLSIFGITFTKYNKNNVKHHLVNTLTISLSMKMNKTLLSDVKTCNIGLSGQATTSASKQQICQLTLRKTLKLLQRLAAILPYNFLLSPQ
jgi:hypothetical protein